MPAVALALLFLPSLGIAQQPPTAPESSQNSSQPQPDADASQMPGMKMGASGQMSMEPQKFIQEIMFYQYSE